MSSERRSITNIWLIWLNHFLPTSAARITSGWSCTAELAACVIWPRTGLKNKQILVEAVVFEVSVWLLYWLHPDVILHQHIKLLIRCSVLPHQNYSMVSSCKEKKEMYMTPSRNDIPALLENMIELRPNLGSWASISFPLYEHSRVCVPTTHFCPPALTGPFFALLKHPSLMTCGQRWTWQVPPEVRRRDCVSL